jgi:hypothetical protein
VLSPLLSNIYLHKLDQFVETVLIPEHSRGKAKAVNPAYQKVNSARQQARKRGDRATARDLLRQLYGMPSKDPQDPGYRRLWYSRYADDHLLGFIGPKVEAEQIKKRLIVFLRDDLKLELSAEKTLITHARTQAARYLGYEITVQHSNSKRARVRRGARPGKRRSTNGKIKLSVPADVIRNQCSRYLWRGKPERRRAIQNLDAYDIVKIFGAEYRGIVQYYLHAHDVSRLNRLHWVAETSMLKTLAAKYDSRVSAMAARYGTKVMTPHGLRKCFEAEVKREGRRSLIARFGGIPLVRQKHAILTDREPVRLVIYPRKELVTRLLKGRCELCQRKESVQTHQIRVLSDLKRGPDQPAWVMTMARKQRKTLVVCQQCHDHIHNGRHATSLTA